MDLKKLIGDATAAIPEELLPVLHEVACGQLKSLVVVGERQDGTICTMWQLDMEDGTSNAFAVIGALEMVKHELMFACDEERDDDD